MHPCKQYIELPPMTVWRGFLLSLAALHIVSAERPVEHDPPETEQEQEEHDFEEHEQSPHTYQAGGPDGIQPYQTPDEFRGLPNEAGQKWKLYTELTTQHDMGKLRAKYTNGVFPDAVRDSGTYNNVKNFLIDKEKLLFGKDRGGTNEDQLSVTRLKNKGSEAFVKNHLYHQALQAYVESLFHASAGAHDITAREYRTHAVIAHNLAQELH